MKIQRNNEQKQERAILVGLVLPGMNRSFEEESLNELALLADTAGAVVIDRVMQERPAPDPATMLGKGKTHQVAKLALDLEANLIIFDCDLNPVQVKNLELETKKKVVDRSGLILDIFARRARSHESQIQVELAQLEYLLPRLTRQWTHLSRQVGGIGTRGPGETQLEVDRRVIKNRIGHLREELRKIEQQRSERRKKRAFIQKVALVGYTNVGKSSLMNMLADASVFVEDRLFATLDATIRSLSLDEHRKVLLIDTVGFIRKLPHHLIASFKSTLEETVESDLLLHVVDVSHPNFEEQMISVQKVLGELGLENKPTIIVFNKVDLLEDRRHLAELKSRFQRVVFTSALKGMGLNSLKDEIAGVLNAEEKEEEVSIACEETGAISMIYRMSEVISAEYKDRVAVIRYRTTSENSERIHHLLEKLCGNKYTYRG